MRGIRWIKIIKYSPYIVLTVGTGFLISFLILSHYIKIEQEAIAVIVVLGVVTTGVITIVFAFLSMLARLYR